MFRVWMHPIFLWRLFASLDSIGLAAAPCLYTVLTHFFAFPPTDMAVKLPKNLFCFWKKTRKKCCFFLNNEIISLFDKIFFFQWLGEAIICLVYCLSTGFISPPQKSRLLLSPQMSQMPHVSGLISCFSCPAADVRSKWSPAVVGPAWCPRNEFFWSLKFMVHLLSMHISVRFFL